MKIIGHRGAAGLAPENTLAAIKAGIKDGADAVEFDVRLTKDRHFVLMHDPTLLRIAGNNTPVSELTLAQLQSTITLSGEPIPTLSEALKVCQNITAVIEAKGIDWAEALTEALKMHPPSGKIAVISFQPAELSKFKASSPDTPCYIVERLNAFRAIRFAHTEGFSGVNFNFWIINPFSYWYARLNKLEILAYTVDRPLYLRYFKTFYPRVAITTNFPGRIKKLIS